MSFEEMTIATFVLMGVLVGYVLGSFFSKKNVFQMVLTKEDVENAIKTVNEMNNAEEMGEDPSEIKPIQLSDDTLNSMGVDTIKASNKKDFEDEEENGGYKFYKVHLPILSVGKNPEDAYYGLLKMFKKFKNNRIGNNGFLVEKDAFVERISRSEADRELSV